MENPHINMFARVSLNKCRLLAGAAVGVAMLTGGMLSDVSGASVAATYEFDGNFAADQIGAPALTPIDPQGTSVFQTDTVLGATRQVWSFNGTTDPNQQSGFTLNTTGLIAPENYSIDMVCKFTLGNNAWRRLVDVQNRQSDNGFYVDPTNNLDIYPVSGSTAAWTNDVYHHIVLTDDGTTVSVYLDGVSQFSATTAELNLDFDPTNNPNRLLGFFVDNVVAGGQGEWSPGSVALARVWNGVLTPAEAAELAANPFAVPEPATDVALGVALVALIAVARNRRRSRST